MSTLELLLTEAEVQEAVRRLGLTLSEDFAGEQLVLVGVLKGSVVFLADLCREISVPVQLEFVRARSYGNGRQSTGEVQITTGVEGDIAGRHVVVVEDIADTGRTMESIASYLRARRPASVSTCALLVRAGAVKPEYAGIEIGPGFVVGYGMDHAEQFRGLRDIHLLTDSDVVADPPA